MKLTDAFPSKWLSAANLDGQPRLVTIERCSLEAIEQGQPSKLVLTLKGLTQGLVVNKTNGNAIAEFLGEDCDAWAGQRIVIYPTRVDFQGKLVDAIRVRAPKPQAVAPAPAPALAAVVPAPAPPATPLAPTRPSKAGEELPVDADDVLF